MRMIDEKIDEILASASEECQSRYQVDVSLPHIRAQMITACKQKLRLTIMQRHRMCQVCMKEDSHPIYCEFGFTGYFLCTDHGDENIWQLVDAQNRGKPPQ